MLTTTNIDLSHIKKAQAVFEKFRRNLTTEQEMAGAVQAFEFCFELAWKIMKRVLQNNGLEVGSPRDTFRKAFAEKLIGDPQIWFEFQEKRNLVAHTYNQENLDLIIQSFDAFSHELQKLLSKLESQ